MRFAVGLVVNAWVFGVPIVLMAWAALRLLHRAPARVRYLLVIAAFFAVIAMPLIPREQGAAAGVVVEKTADVITFPLVLLWTIGAAILLTREAIGHLRLRRPREEASAELRRLLEWPGRVPLMVSDATPPLTVGLLAPRVVLPRDIASTFPLDVARRIARHELAHCRWRDPLVYALMRIAASLFWPWPVWPLLRWARREREVAADEFALRAPAGDEEHYVAALLRLAHVHRSVAAAMAANDLEFRARRILGATPRSSVALSVLVFTVAAALVTNAQPVSVETLEPLTLRNASVPPAERAASGRRPEGGSETLPAQPARTPAFHNVNEVAAPSDVAAPAEVHVQVSVHRHVNIHRHVVDAQENE